MWTHSDPRRVALAVYSVSPASYKYNEPYSISRFLLCGELVFYRDNYFMSMMPYFIIWREFSCVLLAEFLRTASQAAA